MVKLKYVATDPAKPWCFTTFEEKDGAWVPQVEPETEIDAWIRRALEGMRRMDLDPEYRRHIQSRIS